jgi:hypothetical protein
MRLYCVYRRPIDFPDVFVVRILEGSTPGEVVAIGETLESVRSQLPSGLTNIGRDSQDEPQIVEVWI